MKLIWLLILFLIALFLDSVKTVKLKVTFNKDTYTKDSSSYQSYISESNAISNKSGYKSGFNSNSSNKINTSKFSEKETNKNFEESMKIGEASQVSAEGEEDNGSEIELEEGDKSKNASEHSNKDSSKMVTGKDDENSDADEDEDDDQSELEKKNSEKVAEGSSKSNLAQVQYEARQRKFNLANTVYSPPDVTNTNYVFLTPSVQKTIDKKIINLQKEGKRHGSMRETKAVGEWQKRYYRRPVEYTEVRSTNHGESSTLTWIILCFVLILVCILFICGAKFFCKK